MVTPVSYYSAGEVTSPRFAFAFAKGCGGQITDDLEYLFPGPVALFGSPAAWPLLRKAQAESRPYYYSDHAYLGRSKFFRITRNAYQHDGTGPGDPNRFLVFHREVQPWRRTGSHVLVCPNSAVYCHLHGFDVHEWLRTVTTTIRAHTDREIRIRWKVDQRMKSIKDDLVDAWAVVVFSSASALDALITGVPVFVLAPFAAGYRLGLDDLTKIESPIYPDGREPFMHALCSNQWNLQEIYSGMAWRHLQEQSAVAA